MVMIQVWSWRNGDEELGSVGIGTGIGHGQNSRMIEIVQRAEFILELIAWSTHTHSKRVSALNHEIWNDTMKNGSCIKGFALHGFVGFWISPFLGSFSETNKVFYSFWSFVLEQGQCDGSEVGFNHGNRVFYRSKRVDGNR